MVTGYNLYVLNPEVLHAPPTINQPSDMVSANNAIMLSSTDSQLIADVLISDLSAASENGFVPQTRDPRVLSLGRSTPPWALTIPAPP